MNIKLLSDTAIIPTRGSEEAAGWDLYADIESPVVVPPSPDDDDIVARKISTGIAIELPENTFGAIFARSGLATKQGIRPANCVGVIDSDYRGPVIVAVRNDTKEPQTINPGDRIAQLVVIPYLSVDINVVNELTDTSRGEGGFGSTGK